MAIRKRKVQANYLKVNNKFEQLSVGFTELNESPSPQTSSKRYIHQSGATQSITSYEWSSAFTADQIENETVIEYLRNIGEMLVTGAGTETEYLIVDLDKPSKDGGFRARKFDVAIQIDEFGDEDGDLTMSGSFLGKGDPIEGTVTIVDGNVTFTEGFEDKTLEFEYTATGSITNISVAGIEYNDTDNKFINIPLKVTTFTFKDGSNTKTATLGQSWTVA